MSNTKVRALYEFWAENEAELSFQVGDIITVITNDDPGWWEGELNGQRGLFPSNYVEILPSATAPLPPPVHNKLATSVPMSPAPTATAVAAAAAVATMAATNNVSTAPSVRTEQKENVPKSSVPSARPLESKTKFGAWSSNMGWYTGPTLVVCGIAGGLFYDQNTLPIISNAVTLIISLYAIFLGIGILLYEFILGYGQRRGASKIPFRGILYTLLSVPLYLSFPTLMPAFFVTTIGIVNFVATAKGEVYDAPPKQQAAASKESRMADTWIGSIKMFFASIRQQNKTGVAIFLLAYIAGNIALFIWALLYWYDYISTKNKLSRWVPWAKAFGNILDLNCSIIVVPVLRTILRWLYNRSTADQGLISRALRAVLYFVPLDQNLSFHKLIARVVLWATVAHTIFHFINLAYHTTNVLDAFNGSWAIVSGGIVCYFMLILYSATWDNTMCGQFEIFWYSHHCFVLFFIFLFVHGKNGLNPGFWKYFIAPGSLYVIERLLRVYRARQKVVVLSVTLMEDVFSLEFAKEGVFASPYKEGQYIFLNSPAISAIQWHPFTISSAPEERTVTVHIRVMGEGSWTRGLCQYIGAMGPRNKPFFQLDRQGPQGKIQGKILGPDGRPMLCIDGPHSAPTQHVGEYSVCMIMGAGIGATPVSATMKSVVFHKWKYYIGQCFPDHAYFCLVIAHRDIDAFRWLIRIIKDAQDEVIHMRASNAQNMATKTFEVHIFLTSTPKGQQPIDVVVDDEIGFWGVPRAEDKVEKVRANWDEADLYKIMKCPPPHTQLGDVHIWEGRPNWETRFNAVAAKHPTGNIGVAFCGNPMIGKDLKKMCYLQNQTRKDGNFRLHKENF